MLCRADRAGRLRRGRDRRHRAAQRVTPTSRSSGTPRSTSRRASTTRSCPGPRARSTDQGRAGATLAPVHISRWRPGDTGAHARGVRERLSAVPARSAGCRRRRPERRGLDSLPPMIYDDDADLSLLDGKTVAIIGYGSQGHAHALNLKDSGVNVVVGLREDSSSVAKAREQGLEVLPVVEAASRGDLVMMLAPRRAPPPGVGGRRSATGSPRATCSCSAMASRSTTKRSTPPPGVDVAMVAPKGPGHLVRRQFTEGSGVPGLIAVEQDATGNARALALAYAKGIGCTRGGVIETTLQGRDRDGPVRRAGRPLRRRLRARPGGLRDARGRGL